MQLYVTSENPPQRPTNIVCVNNRTNTSVFLFFYYVLNKEFLNIWHTVQFTRHVTFSRLVWTLFLFSCLKYFQYKYSLSLIEFWRKARRGNWFKYDLCSETTATQILEKRRVAKPVLYIFKAACRLTNFLQIFYVLWNK